MAEVSRSNVRLNFLQFVAKRIQVAGIDTRKITGISLLERANGIEPSALAWEARVLPLYDARE